MRANKNCFFNQKFLYSRPIAEVNKMASKAGLSVVVWSL